MPKPTHLLPCLALALLLGLAGCRHTGSTHAADTPANAVSTATTATTKERLVRLTPQQQHDEELKRWNAWPIREGHSPERAWQGVLHLLRTVPRFADITPEIAGPALGMPGQSLPPPLRGYSARIHPDWALGWALDERTSLPMVDVSLGHRPQMGAPYVDPAPVCDGPTDWAALRGALEEMGYEVWSSVSELGHYTYNDRYALTITLLPSSQLRKTCINSIKIMPLSPISSRVRR